jgi:hypothetical protein
MSDSLHLPSSKTQAWVGASEQPVTTGEAGASCAAEFAWVCQSEGGRPDQRRKA